MSAEGKCIYCLQDLQTRTEVRQLTCTHQTCSGCLKERIAVNSDVKCAECGHVTEKMCLEMAQVVSSYQPPGCQSLSCAMEPTTFCRTCSKTFCKQHTQFHAEMFHEHCKDVIDIETYNQQVGRWKSVDNRCRRHSEEIRGACRKCHVVLCNQCLDEESENDQCDAHEAVSTHKGASLAREKLAATTRKLQEVDQKLEKAQKKARLQLDQVKIGAVKTKEKIRAAVVRLKEEIDTKAAELEAAIDASTQEFEITTRGYEKEIHNELMTNQLVEDRTCDFTELQNVITLQHHKSQESDLTSRLSTVQHALNIPQPATTYIKGLNDHIPWTLKTIPAPYYKTVKPVSQKKMSEMCYTVCHLPDGRLVSGGRYGFAGLSTDPTIEASVQGLCVDSSSSCLYAVSFMGKERLIYQVDMNTGDAEIVVRYSFTTNHWIQHIAADKDYVIVSDKEAGGFRVFSKSNYDHQFDICLPETARHPLGVIALSNTLITSDSVNNIVCCFPIEKNPPVFWQLSMECPTGICIDETTNCILVMSSAGLKIYVISMKGELVSTIQVKHDYRSAHDLSVFEDEIVLALRDDGVGVYKIEYEEQQE